MRTTLDIDDDVLLAAKERAAREQRSIGAVLSELARGGLRQSAAVPATRRARQNGGRFAVLPARGEVVTLEHLNTLRDREGV
jgi:hypothetical protein